MATILAGSNHYAIATKLRDAVLQFSEKYGDMAIERLDASESTFDTLQGAVDAMPFLSDKKMVIMRDVSKNPQAAESIQELVDRADASTELIILEGVLDKRSAYYKKLKKLPSFHEFNEPNEHEIAQWACEEAARLDGNITLPDARYLVQRVGLNQTALSHEIEKLVVYDPAITRETIDLLTDESPSGTIFNLLDSAFSGDIARALRLYDEQRAQNVEPLAIHAMLVWQMHVTALCARAPEEKTSAQIAKDASLSPFVVQKSMTSARRMGQARVSEVLSLLRDIDVRAKRQTLDYDEAMRYLIVSLAS